MTVRWQGRVPDLNLEVQSNDGAAVVKRFAEAKLRHTNIKITDDYTLLDSGLTREREGFEEDVLRAMASWPERSLA
jgi:hypothetical protein